MVEVEVGAEAETEAKTLVSFDGGDPAEVETVKAAKAINEEDVDGGDDDDVDDDDDEDGNGCGHGAWAIPEAAAAAAASAASVI